MSATDSAPARRPLGRRAVDAAIARLVLRLPKATTDYTVASDLRVPMRDGTVLLADHLAPMGSSRGTILVRGPYGFNALNRIALGGLFARYGYHVVLTRVRGTFGSEGTLNPFRSEVDDAQDTVAWLRKQSFFNGKFATFGPSYLGFTQWALLADPPPELATSIILVPPHDFSRVVYPYGAFNLDLLLNWADSVTHQEHQSFIGGLLRPAITRRALAAAMSSLPLAEAAERLRGDRAPWFKEWVTRRDLSDPWWSPVQLSGAIDKVSTPVLLQTGWHDLFIDQALEQYTRLRDRGVEVQLTVGPWTHTESLQKGFQTLIPEALDWLAEHLDSDGRRTRAQAVRVQVSGTGEWRSLASWPPATHEQTLHPQADSSLGTSAAAADATPAAFTYDPLDPTPTVGGRMNTPATGGRKDDTALAERPDVLAFTGPPLTARLTIAGTPTVQLDHRSDNPHADLFVRLSEVDSDGQSRNITDGFMRLDPAKEADTIQVQLDPTMHTFKAGNRVRLLVSGGCFPRFERNLGTDTDPATSTTTAPSHRKLHLAGSHLTLPVLD